MKGQLILQSAIKEDSAIDYKKSRFKVNLKVPIQFKKLTLKHADIPFTWGHIMTPYIKKTTPLPEFHVVVNGSEYKAILGRTYTFSLSDLLAEIAYQLNNVSGLNFSFSFDSVNGSVVIKETTYFFDVGTDGLLNKYLGFVLPPGASASYYKNGVQHKAYLSSDYFSGNFIRLALSGINNKTHYMNDEQDSASFVIPYNACHLSFGDKIQHPQNGENLQTLEFDTVQKLQSFTVELYDYDNYPIELNANWCALLEYEL